MSLGDFYQLVEKYVIKNVVERFDSTYYQISILNIYNSDYEFLEEYAHHTNIGFGNDIKDFSKKVLEYEQSLNNKKFDIINCRFSLRYFFDDRDILNTFLDFVSKHLNNMGYFVGFILDAESVGMHLMSRPKIESDPFMLEYLTMNADNNLIDTIKVNDEIIKLKTLKELEVKFLPHGLYYVDSIPFRDIYEIYANTLRMNKTNRFFGLLNLVFIFQKSTQTIF